MSRLVLAATLSSNYGIYGPPFEHCWTEPRELGSEEYLAFGKVPGPSPRSEAARQLEGFHCAGESDPPRISSLANDPGGVQFHEIDNDELICYSRTSADGNEVLLIVVNLDPHHSQVRLDRVAAGRIGAGRTRGPFRCTIC